MRALPRLTAFTVFIPLVLLVSVVVAACGSVVLVEGDGSSTVFPITEAVAEEFTFSEIGRRDRIAVLVGISGTGGGFQKFCNGEIDFNDASRPIKPSELERCAEKGVVPVEFQVAFDGLTVVVNPDNDFVDCLTIEELARIWEPGSDIDNWSDVRPEWPDKSLTLYGPDADSGTFDFFTETVVGEEDASRPDYTASADDNVLVLGIAGDRAALGYFGFAFFDQNAERLRLVAVDGGAGCVAPSRETIADGSYAPLSRPLFVYVRQDALERPEVASFMRFYLTEAPALAVEVGYVEAPAAVYEAGLAKIP